MFSLVIVVYIHLLILHNKQTHSILEMVMLKNSFHSALQAVETDCCGLQVDLK